MKDYQGVEIVRGDLLRDKNGLFAIVYHVGANRITTGEWFKDKERAREVEFSGGSWTQEEIIEFKLTIVERRPLGVFDKNGKEWRYGDFVLYGEECFVFDGIKSFKNNGYDTIFFKHDEFCRGWTFLNANEYSIIRKPLTPEPSLSGKKVSVELDGKKYTATID